MQNWLAIEEPNLFFGVLSPSQSTVVQQPFGKIVFTQRLRIGDRVQLLRHGCVTDGEVVGCSELDPAEPSFQVLFKEPESHLQHHETDDHVRRRLALGEATSAEHDAATFIQAKVRGLDVRRRVMLRGERAQKEKQGTLTLAKSASVVRTFLPRHLRHVPPPAGERDKRAFVFECHLTWSERNAGKTFELPKRGICRSGDVLLLETPIRFTCPEEAPATGVFVVTASMACRALEVSFANMLPSRATWSEAKTHWLADGGLVSTHHKAAISDAYTAFKPKYGTDRRHKDRKLPHAFARLTSTPRQSTRLVQSEDGTITQTCQCASDRFDAARSVHTIEAEYRRTDTFTYTIVQCAHEHAAGLRVGVCSDDGQEAWMLRLSDARLCGASGLPAPKAPSCHEDLRRFLPPNLIGHSINVRVDMMPHGTSSLSFRVADIGGYFLAARDLPYLVRPCVHLTHQGDAVRLHSHDCARMRDPSANMGEATTRDRSEDWAAARYMKGVAAYNRGRAPSPRRDYIRSLRTLRPSSPAQTPRIRTPLTRRAPSPALLSVRASDADRAQVVALTATHAVTCDSRCARCRKHIRTPGKPWCAKCNPRALPDPGSLGHQDWIPDADISA
jgi:hypothetical protein